MYKRQDPNWVVNHAYNAVSYILANDNPIEDGETVDGIIDGQMSRCLLYTSPEYNFLCSTQ